MPRLRCQGPTGRAGRELAAAGARRQSPRNAGPIPLTPQQRAIAELAAGGLSNKHIAQRLNISARTVGNHLYRIFPQLGITTRSGLRDALQRLED